MSEANQKVASRAESNTNLSMLAGVHTGQVKWFNRRRGYGFIKIIQTRDNKEKENESFIGKDVFVHQSHIKPQKSSYRSLEENEYVELGLSVDDKNVTQAVNVTGILGGSLLCDVQTERPVRNFTVPEGETAVESGDFRTPKYHQRRGKNFRPRMTDRRQTETSTDSESNTNNKGDSNYFAGLEESS